MNPLHHWLPVLEGPPGQPVNDPHATTESPEAFLPSRALLERQAVALRDARAESLAHRPIRDIVRVIDRVALRFLDPADELRAAAIEGLPQHTGYSREMIAAIVDGMAADWRSDRLIQLLRRDFGDEAVLDSFAEVDQRGRVHVVSPGLIFHVFSGNVPGVAVTSLIRGLLVKAANLAKTSAGEPLLPVLFARAVAEEDPELGRCLAITYWPGGTRDLEEAAIGASDMVIAYGSDESLAALGKLIPRSKSFVSYSHRLSAGVVLREGTSADAARVTARDAASATAMFDQNGCVSPHTFLVETGGDVTPAAWAELLAEELSAIESRLPRGVISEAESITIQQVRAEAEFKGLAGEDHLVFQSPGGTEWTVVYHPEDRFLPSCLNRTIRVIPVTEAAEIPRLLETFGMYLQTVGMAGPPERIAEIGLALAQLGACRITTLSGMPWPPAWWHHDGRPAVADLVRWCDWETGP